MTPGMKMQAVKPVERFRPGAEVLIEEGCYIVELHNSNADADCSIARARLGPAQARLAFQAPSSGAHTMGGSRSRAPGGPAGEPTIPCPR